MAANHHWMPLGAAILLAILCSVGRAQDALNDGKKEFDQAMATARRAYSTDLANAERQLAKATAAACLKYQGQLEAARKGAADAGERNEAARIAKLIEEVKVAGTPPEETIPGLKKRIRELKGSVAQLWKNPPITVLVNPNHVVAILLPDGTIVADGYANSTWRYEKDVLVMTMPGPDRAAIDYVRLAPNGKSYQGTNQAGIEVVWNVIYGKVPVGVHMP